MKMHNWIFKYGSSLEIVNELARITGYSPFRLVEAAALIHSARPDNIRIAHGSAMWADGITLDISEEPAANLEIWVTAEMGDLLIPVA